MAPALLLAAALGSGLSIELTPLTPDVTVGAEVRLRVVLRADARTVLTPDLCGRLGERSVVTIWRDGPGDPVVYHEGPPVIACPIVVYQGRSRRGGSCPVDIVLRDGWTRPASGEISIEETLVAPAPGLLTFTIGYDGLTSNQVNVRVRER